MKPKVLLVIISLSIGAVVGIKGYFWSMDRWEVFRTAIVRQELLKGELISTEACGLKGMSKKVALR
jgi:hypothetical protein